MTRFKKIALLLAALGAAYFQTQRTLVPGPRPEPATHTVDASALDDAITHQRRNVQVDGRGVVTKILREDHTGSPHQKFLVELPSGRTILIAHNIDLAPRIPDLTPGAALEFRGEYVWNERGGVVHWTHRDPHHQHVDGYLRYVGSIYQ